MSTNSEVAGIFYAIADLLDLQNARFKPEAYRRAARSIEALGEDLRRVAQRGALGQIPGVGEALREKIIEFLHDGRISYYEKLQREFPPGVLELMRVPGIGPKTTGRFYLELQIDSPAALARAIDGGRLEGLFGFGPRKIEKLRQALAQAQGASGSRTPLLAAWKLANALLRELGARTPVHDAAAAGSLRRRREAVGDLDLLVTSSTPATTISTFTQLPGVREVVMQGDTKATVVHAPGIQVDLRVVEPASFGAALQYFTGSKDHNIALRSLARDRGLKINEYGVYRGEERIGGQTEEEVYHILGLPWIPPEIRENQGEIDAARQDKLPPLVTLDDLRGELHRHLPPDPAPELLEAAVGEARRRRFQYLGLVLPVVTTAAELRQFGERLQPLRAGADRGDPVLWIGRELELTDRSWPSRLPPGLDYLIGVPPPASRDSARAPEPPPRAPALAPLFVGHLRLAASTTEAPTDSVGRWLDWCRPRRIALEVTPEGAADGLDSRSARRATAAGVALVLSAGGSSPSDLAALELAVGLARRGWALPESILNARAATDGKPPRPSAPDDRTPLSSPKLRGSSSARRA